MLNFLSTMETIFYGDLRVNYFFLQLAITRLWRFEATAFRKKVDLIISTKSNQALCVLIIFFNM